MKKNEVILFISFLLLFSSCKTSDCNSTNSIFKKYSPESKIYKNELARLLQSQSNKYISFNLVGYIKIEDKEYLQVSVQGINICAQTTILVTQWDAVLQGIKQNHGQGYSGAAMVGLKYNFIDTPNGAQMVYKGVNRIED